MSDLADKPHLPDLVKRMTKRYIASTASGGPSPTILKNRAYKQAKNYVIEMGMEWNDTMEMELLALIDKEVDGLS